MAQLLNIHRGNFLSNNHNFCHYPSNALILHKHESWIYRRKYTGIMKYPRVQKSTQGQMEAIFHDDHDSIQYKDHKITGEKLDSIPYIQTLRTFPKEDLFKRTVLVRFDSTILLGEDLDSRSKSRSDALFTIRYLYEAGARVILASDGSAKNNSQLVSEDSTADFLSSILQLKVVQAQCMSCYEISHTDDIEKSDILLLKNLSNYKEELANCTNFAEKLSYGVDIFVNDSFSQSHKILASTVAIAQFCPFSLAGFHFEESLIQLKEAAKTNSKPYVAIIGGGNFYEKASALHFLTSRCDGLVFVGMMAFQIMHALGFSVPFKLVEHGAVNKAFDLVQFVQRRNIPILYPKDFLCMNTSFPDRLQIFPAHAILDGWIPVDIGTNSLDEINSLLTKCKKILWIGPMKFKMPTYKTSGASILVQTLDKLNQSNCDVTVVGSAACKAITESSCSSSAYNTIESASVFWEFLKGTKLPGLLSLDRAYPHDIDWEFAFSEPSLPLVVDIGSGNGMFLLEMAKRRKDMNFLGLEINHKLVKRCVDSVSLSGMKNIFFIATNATSTFRSIVSSYPGELNLVSILCPNPDFDKPEYRWRMLQRSLVEAVVDLLISEGKVFLQSDIEKVAIRMKEEFLKHGKGKLTVLRDPTNSEGWLSENPFGVRSDWEQHVIDRGDPMYRLMLSKSIFITTL